MDAHVDVTGRAAKCSRVPCATHADALTVVDPGRDVELEWRILQNPPVALAALAGRLDDATRAVAARAGAGADDLAENRAGDMLDDSRPPQPGHVTGVVPAAAPVPAHGSQLRATRTRTSSVVPVAASARSISTCAATSGPRAGRGPALGLCPKRVSPKNAAKTSERLPKSASIDVKPPDCGVAEPVVRPAALRVGEHFVRFGHRSEAALRVRLIADVRVELARELAERALDLGVARVPGDAE